jgi:hypothetical protein
MRIRVKLTQEDIDDGIPTDAEACPIATFILRHLCQQTIAPTVRVRYRTATIVYRSGMMMEAELPRKATRFIDRFDDGDPVDPINFNLDFTAVNYQEA